MSTLAESAARQAKTAAAPAASASAAAAAEAPGEEAIVVTGVRREAAQRQIDTFLQQQLRTASAGSAFLNIKSSMLERIDASFGTLDLTRFVARSERGSAPATTAAVTAAYTATPSAASWR